MSSIFAVAIIGVALLRMYDDLPFQLPFQSNQNRDAAYIRIKNLGAGLVETGAIDKEKFLRLYEQNESLKSEAEKILSGQVDKLKVTEENAQLVLNILWAIGLGNKNPILEEGPMTTRYGNAGNFSSTVGWIVSEGQPMEHYNKHEFIRLTSDQQKLVEEAARQIYRPCCDNSTYFPDCNHGMAMLALLELLASEGATLDEMYETALSMNVFWFPDSYATIAQYMDETGIKNISAKEILGRDYSSLSGFSKVASKVNQVGRQGSSCSVS